MSRQLASKSKDPTFDIRCRKCERLASFLDSVKETQPSYHAAPVAPFGKPGSRMLIVGLAPGMHGANATGRPFTGDHAGILLYETLFAHGLTNQPTGNRADDGLRLINCRITNAVKCLPPANKPTTQEITECNSFLAADLALLPRPGVIIALGQVAHTAVVKALRKRQAEFRFGHANCHALDDQLWLLDSYHCSRYNTQTKRLTAAMFSEVFATAKGLVEAR
ncbi:MAG: uracil-DNA glycosylase [Proteobacteria bacterium]|nr:uracil-DNA glycosylase [Pseudomonadota bacterium]